MKFFSTPNEKKSAIITSFIGTILILIFFVFGLSFIDPPISYGIEVNFGTLSDEKLTKKVTLENSKTSLKNKNIDNNLNDSELKSKTVMQKKSIISIDEKSNNPVTQKKSLDKKKIAQNDSLVKKIIQNNKPKISNLTKKILNNILSAEEIVEANEKPLNENEREIVLWIHIRILIIIKQDWHWEVGWIDGRNLESNGSVEHVCDQEGKVVVRITVNKLGNVVSAEAGVKGSTNVHPCLLEPAKKTAFLHKWFSDENAPEFQIGFVVVNFKLVN